MSTKTGMAAVRAKLVCNPEPGIRAAGESVDF
jgi:hypothetical protein